MKYSAFSDLDLLKMMNSVSSRVLLEGDVRQEDMDELKNVRSEYDRRIRVKNYRKNKLLEVEKV